MGHRALAVLLTGLALVGIPAGRASAQESTDAVAALAQQYAPRVVVREQAQDCGPGEPYQPTPVDDVLGNPEVNLHQADGTTKAAPTAADLSGGPDSYLDYPGDPLNPGCDYERWSNEISAGTPPTLYARVATDPAFPGQLALQYWFFWVYNDWNDKHEGDWEMVQVVFDAPTAAEALHQEPVSVGFAQHEGAETSAWSDPKLRRDGTHPVVYPSQGSHAAYFDQSKWFGKSAAAGFGCDDTSVTAGVHGTLWTPQIVQMAPDDPQLGWLSFEGRWGQRAPSFNNGPTGPNTKTQWSAPISWQTDEGRSGAVAIPTIPGPGVAAFCTVSSTGSMLFIELLDRPALTIGALALVLVIILTLVRATSWRGADITNYDRERRSGQILGAAFRIYGRRFRVFAVLGAIFLAATWAVSQLRHVIVEVGTTPSLTDTHGTTSLIRSAASSLLVIALQGPIVVLFLAACMAVVASPHGSVGVWSALRRAVAPIAPAVVLGFSYLVVALMLVSVWLLPVGLWLVARWATAGPAAMVEGRELRQSLQRSAELTDQRRLRTLALTLLLFFVALGTGPLIGVLLLVLTSLPFGVANAAVVVSYAVLLPVFAISLTLQFYDLRQEQERDELAAVPAS